MRIGFLGNSNNYPFRLARAIRSLGHDVTFFVDRPRSESRHRPESGYADVSYPYSNWVKEIKPIGMMSAVSARWGRKSLLRELNECTGVILNGMAVSLGSYLTCPTIVMLTGSDLDTYANPACIQAVVTTRHPLDILPGVHYVKHSLARRFVSLQRLGITHSRLVEYAVPGILPHGDALLSEMGIMGQRRTSFMLTDIASLPPRQLKEGEGFRIFCATRVQWNRRTDVAHQSPLDNKRTDIMLEGLRKFVGDARMPVEIHLIRVGANVAETEQLIADLGLVPYVRWHEELTQEMFLHEMARADVVLENFNPDGCVGMAVRDAIAMGIPVIAWGKSELFERALGEPLPLYEAQKSDEICTTLNEITHDPAAVARYATRARAFAARWFSTRNAAERCISVFEEARKVG